MRAWRVHEPGEPGRVLRLDRVPDPPPPGPGEVLVRVSAAALNFPDVLLCRGTYQRRPPLPFTPGLEVAGTVIAAGPRVGPGTGAGVAEGDRVYGGTRLPAGGLAEYATLPAAEVFPVPEGMSDAEAAGFYVTYQTAYTGLRRRAGLGAGETLLVHAGAGGVGSAAIQVGLAAGARVLATAGGPDKVRVCRELGAEDAFDYSAGAGAARDRANGDGAGVGDGVDSAGDGADVVRGTGAQRVAGDGARLVRLVEWVRNRTGGRGVDVVWDPVGGAVFDASVRCVAFEGRLCVVGFASGRIPAVPAGHVLVKNISVVGVHWGAYRDRDPDLLRATHDELVRLRTKAERITPLVGDMVPFDRVPAALTRLATRATIGKVVVVP